MAYNFSGKTQIFLDNVEIETTTSHNIDFNTDTETLKFCNGGVVKEVGAEDPSFNIDLVLDVNNDLQRDIITRKDPDKVYAVKFVIAKNLSASVPCKIASRKIGHSAGNKVTVTVDFAAQGPVTWS